jgi:hypothetical protein
MTQSPLRFTLDANQRPQWVNWLNWGGQRLHQSGIPLVTLSEDSLLAAAQKQSQLSDWGDEHFRVGLQTLLVTLNGEANLSFMGRSLLRKYLTDRLVNRLQIQSTLTQNPDILEVPIERPLIITGLPRTGTTLLQRLLAQDSSFRWLRLWELLQPCPPPEKSAAESDPRIQKTQKFLKRYKTISPAFSTAHFVDAQIPEEGNQLFEHAFANFLFNLRFHAPTYENWLRAQSMVPQYQYYRQQLQLLSWRLPGRWLLKAPCHLRDLSALLQVFPDACIIHMHRNPGTVVPSLCSLAAMSRSIFTKDVELDVVGKDILDITAYSYNKGQQFRQQQSAALVCDVNYSDLVQNPLETVRSIYSFFGDRLQPETANNMQQWLIANPQKKHGTHQYSLEQFGLNEHEVRARFA